MKKVSIIIPVYNVENYLQRCLDSVIRQTLKDIEIILIDDGSTDHSPEICDRYQLSDKRIQVVHQKNGGLSVARNTGLKYATAKYCYFLDSDDYIKEDLLEEMYHVMEFGKFDVVVFNYQKINDNGQMLGNSNLKDETIELKTTEDKITFLSSRLMQYEDIPYEVWNKFYRLDLIKKHKINFALNCKIFAEDICFNLEYFCYAQKIRLHSGSFHFYLIRNNSIMANEYKKVKTGQFSNLAEHVYVRYCQEKDLKKYFPVIFACIIDCDSRMHKLKDTLNAKEDITNSEFYKTQLGLFYKKEKYFQKFLDFDSWFLIMRLKIQYHFWNKNYLRGCLNLIMYDLRKIWFKLRSKE